MCRDGAWLAQCHRDPIRKKCPRACQICTDGKPQLEITVNGYNNADVRETSNTDFRITPVLSKEVPVTTSQMIIKIREGTQQKNK